MLPRVHDPRVIVGTETRDDAAVVRLTADLALVHTTDFFTPIVDDPYDWGAVAAANALSDVYAMGGTPLSALNLLAWPPGDPDLGPDVLERVLRGGSDKCQEAGIAVTGGHSIEDAEPKFGLAVVGLVHPDAVWRNAGARAGDALVLTKPLGSGIVTTGHKRDLATDEEVRAAVAVMARLNGPAAADVKAAGGAHAATDVTGFGLLGHLRQMMKSSGTRARLWWQAVPIQAAAERLARADVVPGGTRANLRAAEGEVRFDAAIAEHEKLLLADAQTSGGLLVALPRHAALELIEALHESDHAAAAIVGEVLAAGDGPVIEVAP
jgi:selenide,water dikinase